MPHSLPRSPPSSPGPPRPPLTHPPLALHPPTRRYIYTEADWCETATDTYLPYNLSKTLAEKRAYELCEGQPPRPDGSRWRLVSILPSFVTGPPASVDIPAEGVAFMKDLLNGKFWPMFAPAIFSFIG